MLTIEGDRYIIKIVRFEIGPDLEINKVFWQFIMDLGRQVLAMYRYRLSANLSIGIRY
jgi:hypothetical protein